MLDGRLSRSLVRLCAFWIWATGLHALPPSEKLTQFGRQNWQTENGLPQNTIHAILQSSSGFLWLGTDGGLVRFDGMRFTTYDAQNTPALKSNDIEALAADRSGNLWFSTPDGVTRWRDGKAETFTAGHGLPAGRPWSVASDSSGNIRATSTEGVLQFSNSRFASVPFPYGANALSKDPARRLLGVTDILHGALNGELSFSLPRGQSIGKVRAILPVGASLWVGTDRGLWGGNNSQFSDLRHVTTKDGLPSDRITALLRDRDGAVWIGTENGIARFSEGNIDTFPSNDPLSSDAINSLFEDREGDIWIGGDTSGLTILRKQEFVTYSFRGPAGSPEIRCVFGSSDGSVWIGTDGGGLKRFRGGKFSTLTTADGLSSNVILSLASEADGALLVGTPDGLDRIPKSSHPALHNKSQSFAEDFIRSLFVDRDGSLWIGTRRGLSHVAGTRVTTYTQSDGLGSDTVGTLLRDNDGNLWIGTFHGLSRLDGTGLHNYTTAQGLSSNVITDLYQDAHGTLWIATQDGGLDVYRNGSFSRFLLANLPKTIFGMTEDRAGDFWIAAKAGIFRANLNTSNSNARSLVAYGTSDGLRVSEGSGGGHPAVWKAKNGDLWFATAHGAALLTVAANSLNRVVPPVAIESVSIDDVTYNPDQLKAIPAGKSRVSFDYAGLSLLAPQKVRYKYRLEGFDKNWIDAGTRRVAYYTNLPPRSYRFRVIACNNDGFWNEAGASLSLRILPHFYQTWWFFFLVLCAAALGSYGTYVWRLQQVHSRFEAVLAERNRIAREIHDTLAQGFVGVSVQLELVSRMLATSTESAREHLDQARILVRRCLTEARQSIWELRSQESADSDFAARFSRLAQQMSESSLVKIHLSVHGQYRSLQPILEDELFRIGQEAITNAVRHSGAKQVRVTLTFDSKKMRMTIADTGCGFAGRVISQGPDGHFGLQGMRERAERINADLNIESTPGMGTTVSVEAPAR